MERQVYEFIFTQTGEKILTRKTCPDCGQEFAITDKDLEFYSKISPVFNGTKYEIPAPTLCPDCRQQRRLARRNERKLYKRKCDLSWKDMISVYSRDSDYKVYDQKEWRSDKRNPLDYGRDFDFTKTFWKQIDELIKDVPCIGLYSWLEMENCHYCNYGNQCKNSYLSINCYLQENALYCKWCSSSEWLWYNNVDCTENNDDCVEVYQSQKLKHCTKVFFSYNSDFCENCRYCYDCTNCKNCVWCTNLKNKQYYIFNQEVSKEYFEEFTKDITQKVNTPGFLKEIKDFLSNRIVKQYRLYNSQDCIWDDLINCNKCYLCFLMLSSENCKYAYESWWFSKYIVDGMEAWDFSEYLYESMMAHKNYKCWFFINSNSCKDSYYCKDCFNSSDLFGCVWLKHKQYCILNKQYTKEEYEVLVPKIIE